MMAAGQTSNVLACTYVCVQCTIGCLGAISVKYRLACLPRSQHSQQGGRVMHWSSASMVPLLKLLLHIAYAAPLSGRQHPFVCSDLSNCCGQRPVVTFAASVAHIADLAFLDCLALTNVIIPNNVQSIGNGAFLHCSNLTSVVIGTGVMHIGNRVFAYCSSLTSIAIPDNVLTIGNGTFLNCASMASLTLGTGVTSIGESAFLYCDSLTSLVIPSNVLSIGNSAFEFCSKLAKVTIGSGVASVGEAAFAYCGRLAHVNILPRHYTTASSMLSAGVFDGCNALACLQGSVPQLPYACNGCKRKSLGQCTKQQNAITWGKILLLSLVCLLTLLLLYLRGAIDFSERLNFIANVRRAGVVEKKRGRKK